MTGKQRGSQAGRGQRAEVRDVDARSAKQADPSGKDKKLQAARCQPETARSPEGDKSSLGVWC